MTACVLGHVLSFWGAGQRLKLRIHGRGDSHKTSGFAGRHLEARPEKEQEDAKKKGEAFWGEEVLKALKNQQAKSGPRAAGLLKVKYLLQSDLVLKDDHIFIQKTLEHLKSDASDMTSAEAAAIVWLPLA